jgi:ectoine hydroxylase
MERSGVVRSVFASHLHNDLFACLSRLRRLVEPAMQLLGSEVYTHQFKINAKAALQGDQWEWHQDFLYWHKEDGMPKANVLTATVFLQDVTDFNGPMLLIPGSHSLGMIDLEAQAVQPDAEIPPQGSNWMSTLTADLKYKIDKEILSRLLSDHTIYAAKGLAGFVLFFHGNLFHASANNLSASDRMSIFISYNSVANKLPPRENPRPSFIASRDFTPIAPLNDDALAAITQPNLAGRANRETTGRDLADVDLADIKGEWR